MALCPVTLNRTRYPVVESHAMITHYCLEALLFDKEQTALMMEQVVHPSIFMLMSRLRDGTEWVKLETMTITEKVLLRDDIQSITDVSQYLIGCGATPPSAELLAEGSPVECCCPSICYASSKCLSDLATIIKLYCPTPGGEEWMKHISSAAKSAATIADSWKAIEASPEFPGYSPGSNSILFMSCRGSRLESCLDLEARVSALGSVATSHCPSKTRVLVICQFWTRTTNLVVLAVEPPVSDRSAHLFEILVELVDNFGFPDSVVEGGAGGESSLELLACLLSSRGEYAEYSMTGRMLRQPMSPALHAAYLCARMRKMFDPISPAEPWSPGQLSLVGVLQGGVQPCILAIQTAVDPLFRLVAFPHLSSQDHDTIHQAMGDVLYMLLLLNPLFSESTSKQSFLINHITVPGFAGFRDEVVTLATKTCTSCGDFNDIQLPFFFPSTPEAVVKFQALKSQMLDTQDLKSQIYVTAITISALVPSLVAFLAARLSLQLFWVLAVGLGSSIQVIQLSVLTSSFATVTFVMLALHVHARDPAIVSSLWIWSLLQGITNDRAAGSSAAQFPSGSQHEDDEMSLWLTHHRLMKAAFLTAMRWKRRSQVAYDD
ncbi:hypothetical protein C8R45DRAFT_932889 [Mycena sanguinolenta]|nr:hypothetical protein C8R45DRAFT_932889 [Mycena sanguinolenta]